MQLGMLFNDPLMAGQGRNMHSTLCEVSHHAQGHWNPRLKRGMPPQSIVSNVPFFRDPVQTIFREHSGRHYLLF